MFASLNDAAVPTEGRLIGPLLVVLGWGAVGGMLRGLKERPGYSLEVPFTSRRINLGFLGDLAVGSAGGIAIFLVAASLLNGQIVRVLQDPVAFFQVGALTLIAGFLGPQLITAISEKLGDDLLKKLDKQVGQIETKVEQIEVRGQSDDLVKIGEFHLNQKRYNTAIRFFDEALKLDPTNDFALTRCAYAWKRLSPPNNLQRALDLVERATKINAKNDRAWYNTACYKALLHYESEQVYSDLEKAVELSRIYIDIAREDEDLVSLREYPPFQKLISEAGA